MNSKISAKRSGIIFQNLNGKMGIAYHDENRRGVEEINIHICDSDYKKTGAKVIWPVDQVKQIGFIN